MGIKKQLGQKIRRIRLNRGLTQEQLSEMIDVSQRTLSGIETGDNFVTAETFDKLSKSLNVSIEDFFFTEHLKSEEELSDEIIKSVKLLRNNPQKLEFLYRIVQALKLE